LLLETVTELLELRLLSGGAIELLLLTELLVARLLLMLELLSTARLLLLTSPGAVELLTTLLLLELEGVGSGALGTTLPPPQADSTAALNIMVSSFIELIGKTSLL